MSPEHHETLQKKTPKKNKWNNTRCERNYDTIRLQRCAALAGGPRPHSGPRQYLRISAILEFSMGVPRCFFSSFFFCFFFLLFFFFFFSVPPDFAENASSEVEIASDLTPSGGSSIFLEYLFRVSFSSIFFYERTGRPEVFFFLLFTNPNRRRHGDRTLSGPFIDTWGTSPWKKSILTNRFLRRKGRGGGSGMATRGPMTLRSGSLPKMVACVFISVPFFFLNHFLCWGVVVFLLCLLSLLLLRLLFGLSRFLIDAEAVSNRSVVVFCFFF